MAYDQELAQRTRQSLASRSGIVEKKMFGGVGFLYHGNLVCGVQGDNLIVRVGADKNEEALSMPFVRPFTVRGRKPMAGWVLVSAEGVENIRDLQSWIDWGYAFTLTLPEKL